MFLKVSKLASNKVSKERLLKWVKLKQPKFKVGDIVVFKTQKHLSPQKITFHEKESWKYAVWPEWHWWTEDGLELYKAKEDMNKTIYTNLTKLVAKIQNDYKKTLKKYNNLYYNEYIFYPNIKIKIIDWYNWILLIVNEIANKASQFKTINNIKGGNLLNYIIKYELEYLYEFEYERMSTSWKEILSRILKRDIMDSRNKKDIELLEFDYDRISSSWQKVLDIILKYVEYIKSNILEWTNATADTNSL